MPDYAPVERERKNKRARTSLSSASRQMLWSEIAVGDVFESGPFEVDADEMLSFNRKWDRLPIHLSDEFARQANYQEVIASGQYTLCIKQTFVSNMPWAASIVGAIAFEDLRFHAPVYGGDTLTMVTKIVDKRITRKRPGCGIMKAHMALSNQSGAIVLSYVDVIMLAIDS